MIAMYRTVIHSNQHEFSQFSELFTHDASSQWRMNARNIHVTHRQPLSRPVLDRLRQSFRVDINTLPPAFDPGQVRLFISDMDSTLIAIECIDEIADFINVKPQVAKITESAMAGEIDFATSLKKRVALLRGLPQQQLQRVYDERLRLNPGVENLIIGFKKRGIKTALVSGGFTFFSERLQHRLDLDFQLANLLGIENNVLTGDVVGPIVTGERKQEYLRELCELLNINTNQAIAAGDGANDLPMLTLAGLGVAYQGKPLLQEKADIVINYSGLDAILDFFEDA